MLADVGEVGRLRENRGHRDQLGGGTAWTNKDGNPSKGNDCGAGDGKGCKMNFAGKLSGQVSMKRSPDVCAHVAQCHSETEASVCHPHCGRLCPSDSMPLKGLRLLGLAWNPGQASKLSSTILGINKRRQKDKLKNINNSPPDH